MEDKQRMRKSLGYGAISCMDLELAVRERCGNDECIWVPLSDREPRVLKRSRLGENAGFNATSQLMKCGLLSITFQR
jgi:hypothetical protein